MARLIRTAGLNQIGPPPRVVRMSDPGALPRRPSKYKLRRIRQIQKWMEEHPESEIVKVFKEGAKRRVVTTARLLAGENAHRRKPVTLPKLKCLGQDP